MYIEWLPPALPLPTLVCACRTYYILVIPLDFHHRSFVLFPSIGKIVAHAENHHHPCDETAIVHRFRRRRRRWGPEAENEEECEIEARESIVGDAKDTGDPPRSPTEPGSGGVDEPVSGVGLQLDGAGAATVE